MRVAGRAMIRLPLRRIVDSVNIRVSGQPAGQSNQAAGQR